MRHTFLFKGKFYDQIDGVAMRSPLAPVLASLFVSHYEKELLSNYDDVSPSYYTHNIFMTFFRFSIWTIRQNIFSLILIQDTLILIYYGNRGL